MGSLVFSEERGGEMGKFKDTVINERTEVIFVGEQDLVIEWLLSDKSPDESTLRVCAGHNQQIFSATEYLKRKTKKTAEIKPKKPEETCPIHIDVGSVWCKWPNINSLKYTFKIQSVELKGGRWMVFGEVEHGSESIHTDTTIILPLYEFINHCILVQGSHRDDAKNLGLNGN
jgi:hypothetical protein